MPTMYSTRGAYAPYFFLTDSAKAQFMAQEVAGLSLTELIDGIFASMDPIRGVDKRWCSMGRQLALHRELVKRGGFFLDSQPYGPHACPGKCQDCRFWADGHVSWQGWDRYGTCRIAPAVLEKHANDGCGSWESRELPGWTSSDWSPRLQTIREAAANLHA